MPQCCLEVLQISSSELYALLVEQGGGAVEPDGALRTEGSA
jgi:hypothetical protein